MANEFVKKPNLIESYTPEQQYELYKCMRDPIYFMKTYMKVMHPKKGAVPFRLFDYQEEAVRSFISNKDTILMMGRQQGKTTVISAYLLWYACFNGGFQAAEESRIARELSGDVESDGDEDGKYILVASKDNDAAMDVLERIKFSYEELPMWIKPGVTIFNRHEVTFDNGSTIKSQATTENTGRGRSVALLMIDELAFVKTEIQHKMWASLAPTLSNGGKCILSSTPNGDKDLFAELWREAQSGGPGAFCPIFAPWHRHPDRTPEYAEEMKRKVGELMFRQEYNCEFLSNDPLLIDSVKALDMMALTSEPDYVKEQVKFWGKINHREQLLVGADVSEGLGKDYSTIQCFDAKTLEQVAEFRSSTTNEADLYEKLKWLFTYLLSQKNPRTGRGPDILWSYENNAQGKVISTLYDRDTNFPDVELISVGDKRGMNTNVATKSDASKLFKKLIEQKGGYKVKSKFLVVELQNYIKATNQGTYAAKKGATDDLISSSLIVTRLLKYLANHEDEVFDVLYKGAEAGETSEEEDGSIEPMPMGFL